MPDVIERPTLARKRKADPMAVVSFRPPDAAFGDWLEKWASEIGISRGEACRRLTMFAATGVDMRCYKEIETLAELLELRSDDWYVLLLELRALFRDIDDGLRKYELDLSPLAQRGIVASYITAAREGREVKIDVRAIAKAIAGRVDRKAKKAGLR